MIFNLLSLTAVPVTCRSQCPIPTYLLDIKPIHWSEIYIRPIPSRVSFILLLFYYSTLCCRMDILQQMTEMILTY